jgi:predicted ferric reductase
VRRIAYETFLRAHQVLIVAVIVGVWLHSPGHQFQTPILYMLISSCIWAFLRLLRLITILIRSHVGKHDCRATIWSLPDAFQVHVTVTRPWKYHAGQYVYLRLRRAGYGTRLQTHPYFISWWYVDARGRNVVVLIIGRQRGFSRGLGKHTNGDLVVAKEDDGRLILASDATEHGTSYMAHIEGPYGRELELDAYGTVLLIATGSGIAGVFPFIRQLLEGYHRWDAKVRRLILVWEVERERGFGHCPSLGAKLTAI